MVGVFRPGARGDVDGETPEVDGALLDDVVQQVKDAFYLVANDIGADLVPLKSLKLTVKTVLEWTVAGGPKFKIPFVEVEIELGHSITHERTHTIEIELKPPAADVAEAAREALAPQLAEALRTIRRTVQAAASSEPKLELGEGTIELNFVVTHDSKAKLIVFSRERKDVTTHTLLVTVGKP
jgi:Trypsin-co-occurring domain 2